MTVLRAFSPSASLSLLLVLSACSDTSPPAEAAADASVSDAASTELATCGPAPYVTMTTNVKGGSTSGDSPLPGATFTTPLCPDRAIESDDKGTFVGRISKGVPFYGRFEAKNYVKTLTPELTFDADATQDFTVPPSLFALLVPDLGPTTTAIFVGAMKDGGHGECAKLDGIRFTVPGHPEARVTYFSTDQLPKPTTSDVTTASGRASVVGLAPGAPVALEGSKAGCVVTFQRAPNTGRAPLEAGYLTLIAAYVRDASGSPDAGSDANVADATSD